MRLCQSADFLSCTPQWQVKNMQEIGGPDLINFTIIDVWLITRKSSDGQLIQSEVPAFTHPDHKSVRTMTKRANSAVVWIIFFFGNILFIMIITRMKENLIILRWMMNVSRIKGNQCRKAVMKFTVHQCEFLFVLTISGVMVIKRHSSFAISLIG